MRKITIDKTEDGIKLHRYLKNIFKEMPNSLLQKLLRKKYFEVNDIVANGNEILKFNDVINVYLGDETFNKFFTSSNTIDKHASNDDTPFNIDEYYDKIVNNIVYEDDNLIIFNKWAGLLSQGDKSNDISVNSLLNHYLTNSYDKDILDKIALYKFNPSIVNRLDRNTEGLIIFAKSYIFAREISKMISENKINKYYKTIVNGILEKDDDILVNLYKKDDKNNIAIIKDIDKNDDKVSYDGYSIVKLEYKILKRDVDSTTLEIKLITGKSHQIRAQLSHIGHPIVCDKKYMVKSLYDENVKKYKTRSQILSCYKIVFDSFKNEELKYLSHKSFELKLDLYK